MNNSYIFEGLDASWFSTPEKRANWWDLLNSEWKRVFTLLCDLINEDKQRSIDDDINTIFEITFLELIYDFKLNYGHEQVSLQGVKNLTNLIRLDIPESNIKYLNDLSGLSKLEILDVYSNKIENIEPLAKLTSLKQLVLDDNLISDITAIKDLKNLNCLYLNKNKINNIACLSNAVNITVLGLSFNNLSNIEVVSNFKKLINLNISHNNISDINCIRGLKQLKILDLKNNPISSLDPLIYCKNIELLDIKGCCITNDELLNFKKNNPSCIVIHDELSDEDAKKELKWHAGKSFRSQLQKSNTLPDGKHIVTIEKVEEYFIDQSISEEYSDSTPVIGILFRKEKHSIASHFRMKGFITIDDFEVGATPDNLKFAVSPLGQMCAIDLRTNRRIEDPSRTKVLQEKFKSIIEDCGLYSFLEFAPCDLIGKVIGIEIRAGRLYSTYRVY